MDSFRTASQLKVGHRAYTIYRLDALKRHGFAVERLPYSLRILLENLLRTENGSSVTRADIEALAGWRPNSPERAEIAFQPARVLLQDFTGVPAIVDLAAMRDAMVRLGGDPAKINPLQPVELVIDHSIQADAFGVPGAMAINQKLDYMRNGERYALLKWGQQAFKNFRVAPPNSGICHQVNIEYLARVVFGADEDSKGNPASGAVLPLAYPDTLVGTDSHTPMVNGLGILGWGVGGIEAEAAMLGQPISMLIPEVVGFKLTGKLREGVTATDLVLTVTQMLRKKGVVGRFVEFCGPGVSNVPVVDRATIGNMSPEYGSTCAIFPIDTLTLDYLRLTARSEERVALVEAYMKEQGLFHDSTAPEPMFSDTLELDLSEVEPSIAGPGRPQDRVSLRRAKVAFEACLPSLLPPSSPRSRKGADARTSHHERLDVWGESSAGDFGGGPLHPVVGGADVLEHGSIVIAAITSCTNTSNPSVMLAAGLLAKRAVERGLSRQPWVKTSLAPGSRVVTAYYERAGLTPYLEQLGFNLVGYGCTTCIGNSGPLPTEISEEIERRNLVVAAALSGNRNFEGRIHSEVRANYLMSPPLVVAFALAGRITIDLETEPLGHDREGRPVFLRDIWPSQEEIRLTMREATGSKLYLENYREIFAGDEQWRTLQAPTGNIYNWDQTSTYVRSPPFFEKMPRKAPLEVENIRGARALAVFGDSITTDHISPAGTIQVQSPAGEYLVSEAVAPKDFNSYGSRRGNHEVMVRGTFANVRIRNRLAPGTEGGYTTYLPRHEVTSIYEASQRYLEKGIPLLVLAGKDYGSGSSRDWAAKGPYLQGVRAVIAESFERIHRSNLVGMGILPLQFADGSSVASLGLTGSEIFDIDGVTTGVASGFAQSRRLKVRARREDGSAVEFEVSARIETPQEVLYIRHGGILQYVLRQLLGGPSEVSATPARKPHPLPAEGAQDRTVDEGSIQSFPASDPASYTGSTRV
ncbi:aconitate hydratase AcnA [Bradyrhizobium sp. sBnM-33]|uniref:aconitate hydratase AcnA n=1 Tax=Bradyrhizobium sp. sBnM-33 TaxID=2831780 RepID=UPI001BCECF13|nr:aconitate hydratase AcnA [Bradyrhizobium sp. sBnM-33]WOH53272.1 aconitate hydratase AcnA [Bradyrhizobium sp. sBnM-33]